MNCPECGASMEQGWLFASKDGAFGFASRVPGVFENARNAEGFVQITEPKLGCRTNVRAWHCAGCKVLHSNTSSRHALRRYACLRPQSCSTCIAPLEASGYVVE